MDRGDLECVESHRANSAGIPARPAIIETMAILEQPSINVDQTHLRPPLADSARVSKLAAFLIEVRERDEPTNVAQVRQLSPFRYPGGKTWLVPEIRKWLQNGGRRPTVFVEPFAGGAMAGLTAASENLAERVVLSELDQDVAAVWRATFDGEAPDFEWLCNRILTFHVTLDNVSNTIHGPAKSVCEMAFRTIVKNRMQRGGVMAPGAGLIKTGEAGRGLNSRWYPETLTKRLRLLRTLRNRVTFLHQDGFAVVEAFVDDPDAFFFVDPPYTAGGKKAGSRLYAHSEIDHSELFSLMSRVRGTVLMTYDDALEVRILARKHSFRVQEIPMKNSHHSIIRELLLLRP